MLALGISALLHLGGSGFRNERLRPKGTGHMRLKLLLIASSVATLVGSGGAIAIILGVWPTLTPLTKPGLVVLSTFMVPVVTTLLASLFVYRHTARRRKLQALLTAILTIVLCLAVYAIAVMMNIPPRPRVEPVPPQNIG
jgi:purine-cytosine permease-like protein